MLGNVMRGKALAFPSDTVAPFRIVQSFYAERFIPCPVWCLTRGTEGAGKWGGGKRALFLFISPRTSMEKGVHIPLRGYSPGPKTETCSPMDSGPNCQECSRVDSLREARRQKYLWPPPVRKGFIFERRKKNTMSIKPPVAHLVSEWVKSPSCVQLFATPWTVAYQTPPSMEFSRQEYWSGLTLPSPS